MAKGIEALTQRLMGDVTNSTCVRLQQSILYSVKQKYKHKESGKNSKKSIIAHPYGS